MNEIFCFILYWVLMIFFFIPMGLIALAMILYLGLNLWMLIWEVLGYCYDYLIKLKKGKV